eukprot:1159695-Pelagomonas_calceolata.AAC.11
MQCKQSIRRYLADTPQQAGSIDTIHTPEAAALLPQLPPCVQHARAPYLCAALLLPPLLLQVCALAPLLPATPASIKHFPVYLYSLLEQVKNRTPAINNICAASGIPLLLCYRGLNETQYRCLQNCPRSMRCP